MKKCEIIGRKETVKLVKFDGFFGWRNTNPSLCLIKIDHSYHTLCIEYLSTDPDIDALISFIRNDKDMRKEVKWAIEEYTRKDFIKVEYHEGLSGAIEASLKHTRRPGWSAPYKKIWNEGGSIHISCYEKISYIKMSKCNNNTPYNKIFIPDLLELIDTIYEEKGKPIDLSQKGGKKLYKYCELHGMRKETNFKVPKYAKAPKEQWTYQWELI